MHCTCSHDSEASDITAEQLYQDAMHNRMVRQQGSPVHHMQAGGSSGSLSKQQLHC